MLGFLMCFLVAAPELPSGSTIFIENGNYSRSVQMVTGSNLSHCAIIFKEGKQSWVYEAAQPNVQRHTLEWYFDWIKKTQKEKPSMQYFLLQPKKEFTQEELKKMFQYANSQVGRPYMAKGYWRNQPVTGTHCSQFVSEVLSQSERWQSMGDKESPLDLYNKIKNDYWWRKN